MVRKKLALLIILLAATALVAVGMSGCEKTAFREESTGESGQILEPADIRAEVGLYTGIADDLASLNLPDDVTDVFPQSVTFDDAVLELSEDATSIYLPQPGTYTVQYGMHTAEGKSATGSYRIIAENVESMPCLDLPMFMTTWLREDNTVAIPAVNVICGTSTTVTATVSDGEKEIPVKDGAFAAEEKLYTITYTVTDEQGHSAQQQVLLLVNPVGIINDFNTAGEETLWGYETRIDGGELFIESAAGNTQIECAENFLCGDWSNGNTLHLVMRNNKAGEAVVGVEVMSDGAWKKLSSIKLNATSPNEALTRTDGELADFAVALAGINKVNGIRITAKCDGGVGIAVDKIYIASENEGTSNDAAVELNSLYPQEVLQKALDIYIPEANQNAVHYQINASSLADVQIGLEYENTTIYTRTTLEKGTNDLIRIPILEDENAVGVLKRITVRNMEDYSVAVSIGNVDCEVVDSIKDYCMSADTSFALAYGDTFYTPNPIMLDERYYSNLSVELYQQSEKIRNLSVGEALYNEKNVSESLQSGTAYSLQYSFVDGVSGESIRLVYPLVAMKHTLSTTLEAATMYVGDHAEITAVPDSEIFTQEQLQRADISSYYREKGRKKWVPFERFNADKSKLYELKYVVSLDGFRSEKRLERFVHNNTETVDFEYEPAAVEMRAVYYSDVPDSYIDERFLHDGGFYDLKLNEYSAEANVSTDWSVSGKQSYRFHHDINGWNGFRIAPNMAEKPVNAVRFWANASVGQNTQISLLTSQGWVYSEKFDMKAGEHQYTVYLERDDVTDVSAFTMQMIGGITVYIDDVEITYVNTLSMSQLEYPTTLDISNGIELARPELYSDIFTEAQLEQAVWKCAYSIDDIEEIEISPNADGVYILNLKKGGYITVTWTAQVEQEIATHTTRFAAGIVPFDVAIQTGRLYQKVTIIAPEYDDLINESKCQSKVEWRLQDGEWEATAVGEKIPLNAVGVYELRYTAEYPLTEAKTIYGERIYKIIVPEKDVLWHFEDSDPWYGAQPYDWNLPVVSSVVETKEDGSHWLAVHSSENYDSWRGITAKNDEGISTWTRTNKLIFTITATKDYPEATFWLKTDRGEEYKSVKLQKGENQIELTLTKPFEKLHTFSIFMPAGRETIYIDDIRTGMTSIPKPARPPRGENVFEDFEYELPDGASFYALDTLPCIEELDDGNHVLSGQYSVDGIGWLGVKDASYDLGQSVKKICLVLMQHTTNPVKLKPTDFWIDTDAGGMYPMNVKQEGDIYTLNFAKTFTQVKTLAVAISKNMGIVYLDNFEFVTKNDDNERPPMAEGVIEDFEGGLPEGSDFYASNTLPHFESVDNNTVLAGQYSADGIAWLGIKNANYRIGKSVRKIQINLTQNSSTSVTMKPADFWIDTDVGSLYPVDLEVVGNVYTLTFAQSFTEIKTFAIAISKDMGVVYLDDLRIVNDPFVVIIPLPHSGVVGTKYVVDLPTVPENATNVLYTFRYRTEENAEWKTIQQINGSYAFIPQKEGTYELAYYVVGMMEGKQYHFEKTVTFLVKARSLDPMLVADFADGDISNASSPTAVIELVERNDGYWLRTYSGAGDWLYLENLGYSADDPIDALLIEMETTALVKPEMVYLYTDEGAFYAQKVTSEDGFYRFSFDKNFGKLDKIGIEISADAPMFIKKVRAHTNLFQVVNPSLEDGKVGETYNVALPTVPETATNVAYTVQYRVKDAAEWKMIDPVDGKYVFTPDTEGIYEIYYQVSGIVEENRYTYEKILEITVIDETIPADPYLIEDFADGDISNASSPTAVIELVERNDGYWLRTYSGAGDWLYLNDLNYSCGRTIDGIEIELTSTGTIAAGSLYVYTDQGEFYATGVTNEGNIYKFTFDKEFTQLNRLAMLVAADSKLEIKKIRAYINSIALRTNTGENAGNCSIALSAFQQIPVNSTSMVQNREIDVLHEIRLFRQMITTRLHKNMQSRDALQNFYQINKLV